MALDHFTPEELAMAVCPDPDNEPANDRRASVAIRINGRTCEIMERKPGDLTGPDGKISQDTQLALERYFAKLDGGQPHRGS